MLITQAPICTTCPNGHTHIVSGDHMFCLTWPQRLPRTGAAMTGALMLAALLAAALLLVWFITRRTR